MCRHKLRSLWEVLRGHFNDIMSKFRRNEKKVGLKVRVAGLINLTPPNIDPPTINNSTL